MLLAGLETLRELGARGGGACGTGRGRVWSRDRRGRRARRGAVDRHAGKVVAAAGSIDISFDLISHPFVQGRPVVEMSPEEYINPGLEPKCESLNAPDFA